MNDDALRRITADLAPNTIDVLAHMPGADLTTLMLEVARRRADATTAADVLRRYRGDRFTPPGPMDARALRRVEDLLFSTLAPDVEPVVLSPVTPLGTHRMAGVAQSRVVTTERSIEVAADPTNGLALEAAVRRRALLRENPHSHERVRLASSQRVIRAQRFDIGVLPHFQLFGLVTAGRDTGNATFERESVLEHVRFFVDAVAKAGPLVATVEVSDFTDGEMAATGVALRDAIERPPGVVVLDRPDRKSGRDYYERMCFKVFVTTANGDRLEVADGGLVDWTQQLVQSRKERMMISGLGVERLATLMTND